ncbi:MAG: FAD synthetase family protein [Tissierellia bacterium]|nr:FAD synthetase family protein [Tissierellia bacterium]MDD4779572.1 FAD synthetase family protein [Tissierellia bacterium]
MIINENPSCVAIGNFDGIHIGHDTLIRRMLELSNEKSLQSIIITFKYIKKELRKSNYNLKYINNLEKRLELLNAYGVDKVDEIELDDIISQYSPEQFIKEILVDIYNSKYIVVGYNFTFGHKAMGNVKTLKEFGEKYNYVVEEIPPVKYNGITVSSTLVRNLVREGKIKDANSLLIQNYTIYYKDIKIDYNKNIAIVNNKNTTVIPADGKYKVKVGERQMNISIKTNKDNSIITFDNLLEKNKDIIFLG